eukprot:scaffold3772_cov390-Prasinococcus_capsulatus_cf.AAC.4
MHTGPAAPRARAGKAVGAGATTVTRLGRYPELNRTACEGQRNNPTAHIDPADPSSSGRGSAAGAGIGAGRGVKREVRGELGGCGP